MPAIAGRLSSKEIAQIVAALANNVVCPRMSTRTGCGIAMASGTAQPDATRRTALQKAAMLRAVHDQNAAQNGKKPNGEMRRSAVGGYGKGRGPLEGEIAHAWAAPIAAMS
jgi:hypothetical protein